MRYQTMKRIRLTLPLLTATVLALTFSGHVQSGEPLQPLPAPEGLPGALVFHGHYRHRSRGVDIAQPSELWVKQRPDGGIVSLAQVPFMGTTELVSGGKDHRPDEFRLRRAPVGDKPGYGMDLEFREGKARLTRRGIRDDCDGKELAVPAGACFDPNSRPDSYCAANVLLRHFSSKKPGEGNEFRVYDWDNTGEALADYTIKVELSGKEKVQVPAGTFEASHFVLTQTSTGNTWFKKRAGQITDFWVLDNGVIVRVLRQREPYEMVLLDYDVPRKLQGLE